MKNLLLFLLLFPLTNGFSQPNLSPKTSDSLWQVWQDETKPDTSRLKAIAKYLYTGYMFNEPDSAFYYATLHYNFAKKKGHKKQMASALNFMGISFAIKGNYDKAIDYYTDCIEIKKEIKDKKGIAISLNNIGVIYREKGDYAKAIDYYKRGLEISKEIGDKNNIWQFLNNIGVIHASRGDFEKAMDYYIKSLKIQEELGNMKEIGNTLNNIGMIYKEQGNYSKSIEYYTKSLKVYEKEGLKYGMSAPLNSIGIIYKTQGNYKKALEYYNRGLEINQEIGDKQGISSSLINIGSIYKAQNKNSIALSYYNRALDLKEEIGDKRGVAIAFHSIGNIFKAQKDYSKALDYLTSSLKIRENIGNKQGIASSLNSIGQIYKHKNDYSQAVNHSTQALELAQDLGATTEIQEASRTLWIVYKELGHHDKSLEMYELHIKMRDSILSEKNKKEVIRQEFKYKYNKQITSDSIKAAEAKKVANARITMQKAQLEKEKTRRYALYGGLALLVLFGGFMYNRFRITNKQKKIIQKQKAEVELQRHEAELQREIVEEKNKEITDSITYAKRIQSAILPPKKLVRQYLPQSFILYKPKDIVAGDFYWMEQVEDTILFAAADCTGHGVPGAMVSVVCNNGLNRSVREYGLLDPGKILDKTREIVISEFEKSEEEVKDGMDISLCLLDLKKKSLKWAGANNPLWIIRDGEILEIKPDKQPIGVVDDPQPFTTHLINLQEQDSIYVFTDGFQDQFGGEKGKKFKPANFKKLLLSIFSESMEEQRQIIDDTFENWKGDIEQLDDVCLISVKV